MKKSLRKTLAIAWFEFTSIVLRRSYIVSNFVLPPALLLLVAVLSVTLFFPQADALIEALDRSALERVGVVDASGFVQIYGNYQPQGAVPTHFVRFDDEATAQQALREDEIDHYVFIEPSYLESGRLRLVSPREESAAGLRRPRLRRWILANLVRHFAVDPSVEARLETPYRLSRLFLDPATGALEESHLALLDPTRLIGLGLSLLLLLAIFVPAGFLFQSVLDERNTRLMELMLSAVSPRQLLLGKMISGMAAGVLPLAFWGVLAGVPGMAGFFYFVLRGEVDLVRLATVGALGLVYVLLGVFLYGSIFVGIGVVGKSPRESQQIVAVLGTIAALPLALAATGLAGGSLESLPVRIASMLPLLTPTLMVTRLAFEIPSWPDLVATMVLLVASIHFSVKISARLLQLSVLSADEIGGLLRARKLLRAS